MRIGIFTITNALNYGAFFQMYAMYKYLLNCGHDVTVYDCDSSLKHKIIRNLSINPKRHVFKRKLINEYKKDRSYLNIKKYNNDSMDIAFLGSDEIWNIDNPHFYHAKEYFGIGINAKKIIAYAPSMGFACKDNIIDNEELNNAIKKIDYCFPRDTSTKSLIDSINVNTDSLEVVDPTILYNSWDQYVKNEGKKNYIVYYSYDSNPPFKDELILFAKDNNLRIISAGFLYDWVDECSYCGPFEFLQLLKSSEYVVTTTFHGTIMSALLDCKFICIPNGQKATNLVDKFDLHHHVLNGKLAHHFLNMNNVSTSSNFNFLSNKCRDILSSIISEI